MVMHVDAANSGDEPDVMMDINTTPLIDVMLVLLVMLIITIPIQLHAVTMELPVGSPPLQNIRPDEVQIDIDENGVVYWQGTSVNLAQWEEKMIGIAALSTQPIVKIRTHKNAPYAVFAKVLADSKRKGLTRMAVIGAEQFVR